MQIVDTFVSINFGSFSFNLLFQTKTSENKICNLLNNFDRKSDIRLQLRRQ